MSQGAKWAAQNGDLGVLKKEVEENGFDVNSDLGMGRQLLHVAADYGQEEVIEYLLSKGANINAKDTHGMTPLMNAVFEDHSKSVTLLLQKGADKTIKCPSGMTIAESAETDEIKKLLQ